MRPTAPVDKEPIQVIHLGSLKSKTANELSTKPAPHRKWIIVSAPLPPNIICAVSAMGTDNKKLIAAKKPNFDLMLNHPFAVKGLYLNGFTFHPGGVHDVSPCEFSVPD
jgi:hypothetical protein